MMMAHRQFSRFGGVGASTACKHSSNSKSGRCRTVLPFHCGGGVRISYPAQYGSIFSSKRCAESLITCTMKTAKLRARRRAAIQLDGCQLGCAASGSRYGTQAPGKVVADRSRAYIPVSLKREIRTAAPRRKAGNATYEQGLNFHLGSAFYSTELLDDRLFYLAGSFALRYHTVR